MATINALMKHLRASGIEISGSTQKRKLRNIGYFHGYKGYRFVKESSKKLPLSNFNEVVSMHDFDMRLKSLMYGNLMSIETALKNRVLEEALEHSGSERFEVIFRKSLTAYKCCKSNGKLKEAWDRRLNLRTIVYQTISKLHNKKDVINHFRDNDLDIPIWALFEVMTLGNLGAFYQCLHDDVKKAICHDLKMPSRNFDSPQVLEKIIFIFKDLRNAVAHNGIILDVRFKASKVDGSLKKLIEFEMNVKNIDFNEITDYVLLLVYLMSRLGFTKKECKQLLQKYEEIIEKNRSALPFNIYSQFIYTGSHAKLNAANGFVRGL